MSQVTVLLRGAYRDFAGRSRVPVEAATVGEALDRLAEACPAVRERLRDEHGRLREHLNVFANEEDIRRLDGERTALREGDVVHIIPAVSGG
ncbi:MAG TPA: ubiquitin-like small modifier protein 1 [Candidatus Dormibacteraeota bacterium]|nr:ubiquitin-like small modifier protein 1 [Candidatus Dormibacteraeota bacterium]